MLGSLEKRITDKNHYVRGLILLCVMIKLRDEVLYNKFAACKANLKKVISRSQTSDIGFRHGMRTRMTRTHETGLSAESAFFLKEVIQMSKEAATATRICDALPTGWREVPGDWRLWPETFRALVECYYCEHFPAADQAYALSGLQQFGTAWNIEHGHKEIEQIYLDQATAHEVRYHANRGRLFRRPCAALSTCWRALICERPERVLDRSARGKARHARTSKEKK